MYNVLIVDDEMYAVKGIVDGVDWERLGVSEVHEAYHAKEAQRILLEERIDLMICDIQMPVMNGLSLLEWTKERLPELRTVFLTCHAEFSYAQQAMRLGTRDYMLKPVVYEELAAVIAHNLKEIEGRRLESTQAQTFQRYYRLWQEHRPELVQAFWRDMINVAEEERPKRLEQAIAAYDLPLTERDPLLLILLSIEEWKRPLSAFDEELLGYALRKAAEEVIVAEYPGHVIEDELGNRMIIIYKRGTGDSDTWKRRCEAYIDACARYFYCDVSCYIGEASAAAEIGTTYHRLLEMEYGNLSRRRQVLFVAERMHRSKESGPVSFLHWTEALESGSPQRLREFVQEAEAWIRERQGSREALMQAYHGILQVVYYVLLRKGISPGTLHERGLDSGPAEATRSSAHLKQWVERVTEALVSIDDSASDDRPEGSIVHQIQRYVKEHLQDEITRDELSNYVHLNPSYLSRLFRIKTGQSLSEYILRERMTRAAELLANTRESVSAIARSLGYDNFSYFAKMFKKVFQTTPQEYRRARE